MRRFRVLRIAYVWISAFGDPLRALRAFKAFPRFFRDYFRYRRQAGAERIAFRDMFPALHERTGTHDLDAHYFYVNAWASRKIATTKPPLHVDVASQVLFSSILSATVPVAFIDYRPLDARVSGMQNIAGDLLRLPLHSESVHSLSCLHVAEHVGLGRYGDAIDVNGTRRAAAELARVLAPGGSLFFAVPVGRERVAFNVHRVHRAKTIRDYFPGLTLREFSGVDDRGRYIENAPLDAIDGNEYGCGLFWFTK